MVTDGRGLDKLKAYLAKPRTYVMDFETNCCDTFYQRRARTLQVGDRDVQYVIDLLAFAETPEKLWAAQGGYRRNGTLLNKHLADGSIERVPVDSRILQPVIDVIQPSLDSDEWLKCGHMLEFEYIVSKWCLGIRAWHFYCTLTAERIIHNGAVPAMLAGFYGLGDLVRRYCRFEIDKSSQTTFDLSSPLTEKQIIYCALDVRLPMAIKAAQEIKLKKAGLQWVTQIENDAIPAFGDLHLNGMYINPKKWQKIIDDNSAALVDAIKKIDTFFLPLVGAKRLPNPDESARLKEIWKGLQTKSQRETELSAEIRTSKSDPVQKAVLVQKRAGVEAVRTALIAPAKAAYAVEAGFCTKKYTDEFDKYEGESAINYNSPTQLLAAIYSGNFGLNAQNFKESNDKTMEKHANLPIIKAIREYRGLKKALGTYGDRWIVDRDHMCTLGNPKPGFTDPDTGRIHARFNQNGTDTGRPSCTNPNLLNVPTGDCREAFESRDGNDMIAKDCAGQELRVLTQYSHEPSWIDAFQKGQDLHSISAAMVSPTLWKGGAVMTATKMVVDGKAVTIPPCAYFGNNKQKCKCPKHKDVRNNYKAVNFGIVYDVAAYSLAIRLGVSQDEAQAILDGWKDTFRITQQTLEGLRKTAYDRGEARTLSGRRRIMREVTYKQAKKSAYEKYGDKCDQQKITKMMASLVAAVKREGGNLPIQGCLRGDVMVLDQEKGIVPISALCGRPVKLWDGNVFASAHVVYSGKKQLVNIELGGRRQIACSPDHKFLVAGTRANYDWKTPAEFNKQTWVKVNAECPEWGEEEITFPDSYIAKAPNGKGVNISAVTDRALLGEFIGRVASDGSISVNQSVTLLVAEHELNILPRIKQMLSYLSPERWAEVTKSKKMHTLAGTWYKSMTSLTLADSEFANQLWLAGVKQKIPDFIYQDSQLLRGYLRGMFDGDGSVNRDGVMLVFGQSGKKEGWARQVQIALGMIGIRSHIASNALSRVVSVVKGDSAMFRDRVGFMNTVKRDKLDAMIEVGFSGPSVRWGDTTAVHTVEVTDEYVDMYDVVDSETHQFMANGLITHNSSADFMKRAMGCGFDKDGEPYLWHILEPEYGALLENFIYDELVTESPEANSEAVSAAVSDAIIRAGAELVKVVPMESEGKIAKTWSK